MQQDRLTAGDTLQFVTSAPQFLASAGWTLHYRLLPRAGGVALQLDASPLGDEHQVQVGPSTTGGWIPGLYAWASWVERSGEVYTVGKGQITIDPDPRTVSAGWDPRTSAQQALDACEAAMATFNATGGKVRKYEIAGRTMEFGSMSELMSLHSFWKARVMAEGGAGGGCGAGGAASRNLLVRFRRP